MWCVVLVPSLSVGGGWGGQMCLLTVLVSRPQVTISRSDGGVGCEMAWCLKLLVLEDNVACVKSDHR